MHEVCPARMSEVTCGEAVVEMLERAGAEVAFGVLSVHNLPLYDAMARRGRMRTVAATSENGALGMADGYARATGRLGVGITSTGVGAANAAGALLEAYTASSRVLHVTGQVDSAVVAHDRGALHGARDQLGLLRSISKAAYRVEAAGDAAQLVCRAIEQVHSERPGPVSIEIPIDLQYARVQEPPADLAPRPPERATPRAGAIAAAVERLARAERPLIWAGGGVIAADASASLLALAEDIGAGVITTQAGRGALPESHPLCIGNFSLEDSVGDLLRDSDVLLAVGTRFRGTRRAAGNCHCRGHSCALTPIQRFCSRTMHRMWRCSGTHRRRWINSPVVYPDSARPTRPGANALHGRAPPHARGGARRSAITRACSRI